MAEVRIELRSITEADLSVLYEIYASTRAEEMALVPEWSEAHKAAFLLQQFNAQHQYYQEHYQGAVFQLIQYDGKPIGRFYIHWNFAPNEIRIMDIALLPAFRGKGIGTGILQEIFKKASEKKQSVTIHVEYNNPALRLYQRLGFQKIGEFNSVYYLMEWKNDR